MKVLQVMAGAEFGVESESFSNINPGSVGAEYVFPNSSSVEYFGLCPDG